jgi:hypothetical protein
VASLAVGLDEALSLQVISFGALIGFAGLLPLWIIRVLVIGLALLDRGISL